MTCTRKQTFEEKIMPNLIIDDTFFCIFESLIQFNNIFCWYSAYSKKHQYIYLVHNGIGSPLKWADLGKPLSFSLCVPNPNICFARARARENTNILFDQTDFHFHFKYWWLVCPTPIYAALVQEEKEKTLTHDQTELWSVENESFHIAMGITTILKKDETSTYIRCVFVWCVRTSWQVLYVY